MFDLKTRKRDFEHQLFFLLEKSQTSGRKSKFQAIERRKVARPRDRRAQSVIRVFFCLPRSFRRRLRNDLRYEIFVFSSSSLDAEKPKNIHLLLFLSKRVRYKNEKKRKEVCELRSTRTLLSSAIVPRSQKWRKGSFFHHRSTSRTRKTRLLFTPPSPARNEKRDTRREKKRLAHLKTPRPFKDVTARHNQKGGKTFFCSLFLRKNRRRESRGRPFAVFLSHLNA